MKSKEDIENLLEGFGKAWPEGGSVVKSVMQKIESTPARPYLSKRRRTVMKSIVGIATCLALGIIIWLIPFFSLTPAVTLAQVQEAIAKQKWMHVKYDNGKESWETLDGEKAYYKEVGGYIAFFDYPKNLDLRYHPDKYGYIEQLIKDGPPWQWTPPSITKIVGFYMDMPEGEATAKQKQGPRYWERHADAIEGRQLVRFDQYERDALGNYLLIEQLWIDPQTRLPLRVRRLMQLGVRKDPDQKYSVGDYDFSDHGPESIYDLGVPRDLPIVKVPINEKYPADVAKVMEFAKTARARFPTNFRLITWTNDRSSEIDVIYWKGTPTNKQKSLFDWSGIQVRKDHYFNLDTRFEKNAEQYHLPLPATAEQVLAWTKTQSPVEIYMTDGKRNFDKEGPFPTTFHNPRKTRLTVRFGSNPGNYSSDIIFRDQWPFIDASGPFIFIEDKTENVTDTIALRTEAGNMRRDYYLDPALDYICMKWVWWEKRSDKWEKEREYNLLDLKQLPQEQWHATKQNLKDYGNPEKKYQPYEITWNWDLQLLEENEFPPDIFNGEKMLEDAKREGAVIETY
ncbi:MAG: hypothetical protein ABSG67_05530 [Thermoguttaceae bacterium]|jgi:hypothetical protein